MKLISKIDEVSDFNISLCEVIWKNDTIEIDGNEIYTGEIATFSIIGSLIKVQTPESKTIIIDSESNFASYPQEFVGDLISNKIFLVSNWNKSYTEKYYKAFDFRLGKLIWEKQSHFGKFIVLDDFLFSTVKSKLYRIDPESCEIIWEIDLKLFGTNLKKNEVLDLVIQKYIGVYNEVLYVRAGNILILGLNLNSGKQVFSYKYEDQLLVLDNLEIDQDNGCIFSIGPYGYFSLDLMTSESELFFLSDQTVKFELELRNLAGYKENLIYFWEGARNPKFGVFNRAIYKIINVFQIDSHLEEPTKIRKVGYGYSKLYVLDRLNRLHIFNTEHLK